MRRIVGLGSVSLLTTLALATTAMAQQPPAPPAQPAPSAAAPAPAEPAAAPTAPTAPPTGAPPAEPGAGVSGGAGFSFGAGGNAFGAQAGAGESAAPAESPEEDRAWRQESLKLNNSLSASTGLIHLSEAGSGAVGTFRVSFLSSYFGGSGYLCNSGHQCANPNGGNNVTSDTVSRVGAHLGLSATILPFFEAYAGLHSYATSNNQGRPELLQVLGDTDIGLKFFSPHAPDHIFSFGGEAQLWLLNGTGGVGLNGSGTSVTLNALGTLDLTNRVNPQERLPLKAFLNLGYTFDNSGKLVADTETARAAAGATYPRITRIERFGLNINRVDNFNIGIGAEGMWNVARPFVEWTFNVPVNRQNYTCNESTLFPGDGCLGNKAGFSTTPSRVTLGVNVYPWLQGLALTGAFDVGTGATKTFIEEVAPEPTWNLYLGVGYGFDTQPPKPVIKQVEVPQYVPRPVAAPVRHVVGTVVEKGTTNPIANAIVRFEGRNLTGMVAGTDGKFETANLDPGTYTFDVSAEGYRDGQCTATVPATAAEQSAAAPAAQPAAPGAPPAAPSAPPAAPPAAPGMTPPPGGEVSGGGNAPVIVNIQCELQALPKVGTVVGSVLDAATQSPVGNANVKITDKLGRELTLQADSGGQFRFENVPPGAVTLTVNAQGYMTSVAKLDVKPREKTNAAISVNKRPKRPNVIVTYNELRLRKKIHFAYDSAKIEPDSMELVEEIADILKHRTDIAEVEIQGHTDNTGTAEYNMRLSQQRADAVRDALIALGVDESRLTSKGYGQTKPLAPNNSAKNRAKNRRVQLIIKEHAKKGHH
jgi:outer membrane protein OmpA-like peptidoglycan-associated protein